MVNYRSWSRKELGMTEATNTYTFTSSVKIYEWVTSRVGP